jgi:hypothetical protein
LLNIILKQTLVLKTYHLNKFLKSNKKQRIITLRIFSNILLQVRLLVGHSIFKQCQRQMLPTIAMMWQI